MPFIGKDLQQDNINYCLFVSLKHSIQIQFCYFLQLQHDKYGSSNLATRFLLLLVSSIIMTTPLVTPLVNSCVNN